jgi:glyoxylase-like metal-dependent hydrolase (beta-lactamase superfamily II)
MTNTPLGPFRVGEVSVTVFNGGDLKHFLRDSLNLAENEWKGRYDTLFVEWVPVPVQCALVQTPEATVLYDAPSPDLGTEDSDLVIPGYTPPPSLISQLASIGVGPEDVSHIVISHAHGDHFNALAAMRQDRSVALYPNAKLLIGRADWEAQRQNPGFEQGETLAAKMFAPYHEQGRLELIEAPTTLAPTVEVLPSPSETPGHLTLRVRSQGVTLYCIGDIYHHSVEVENRPWIVGWADAEATEAARVELEKTALAEDAMIMASHIRGLGRLARSGDGVRWQELVVTV